MIKASLVFSLFVSSIFNGYSQQKPPADNWHLADLKTDGYAGISLKQAYGLLKGKKSQTVVVAIIDSGIDTLQNDLKANFWHNKKEIPNNNIDDDRNGYIDDAAGWNFLGSPAGENLAVSVAEPYRTYHRFKAEFENKKEKGIPAEQQYVFSEWKRAEKIISDDYAAAKKEIGPITSNLAVVERANGVLIRYLKKPIFTKEDLLSITGSKKDSIAAAKELWAQVFGENTFSNASFIADFEGYKKELDEKISHKETPPVDYRDKLLMNNGYDISTKYYGNHNLQTYSGYHGTSVSSIIGAVRDNGTGIDGIADNVQLMMIRAGLGKDEYDKDVATAIRYAVDNGAQIINISLGKQVSPDKKWVDDAVRYAAQKDVLIVHAAGNDAQNIDVDYNYPNAYYIDGTKADNFINVGASGDKSTGGLAAPFTNYGKKMTDIFAPGVSILSDIAGDGTQSADGTSFSSPVVAGVAALLRSYFPKLSAKQIVQIIKASGTPINESVVIPGEKEKKMKFADLSESGKIVNACEAVKLAMTY